MQKQLLSVRVCQTAFGPFSEDWKRSFLRALHLHFKENIIRQQGTFFTISRRRTAVSLLKKATGKRRPGLSIQHAREIFVREDILGLLYINIYELKESGHTTIVCELTANYPQSMYYVKTLSQPAAATNFLFQL
jgi:hypothetical protein